MTLFDRKRKEKQQIAEKHEQHDVVAKELDLRVRRVEAVTNIYRDVLKARDGGWH